jgi:hypothetical protein
MEHTMTTYFATMLADERHKELRDAAAHARLTAGHRSRGPRLAARGPSLWTRARHRRRRSVLSPRTV